MAKAYEILYFNKEYCEIGIKFEGKEAFNYRAPFKDGAFLEGQALEDAIQALYPYSVEELAAITPTLTGGEEIQSKVVVNREG